MPYDHPLPNYLISAKWELKIFSNEFQFEEPHITIIRGQMRWRFGLRSLDFMDRRPDPRGINDRIVKIIHRDVALLRAAWDREHGNNPV